MMDADPSVVLEWLDAKDGGIPYLQLTALEQLCNEILFSDNVNTICERYPPHRFVPTLLKIFLDPEAPVMVLEANARAISYYLDMQIDFGDYFAEIPEVFPALASHLDCLDMSCTKSNEFGQQLIKLLKILCDNVLTTVCTNRLLTSLLQFLRNHASKLHSDVRQAGLDTMRKLFTKANPAVIGCHLPSWIQSLADLLECNESGVADQALQAFSNLVSRFAKCGADPTPLASPYIIDHLLRRLRVAGGVESDSTNTVSSAATNNSPAVVQAITNILITLCSCGSTMVLPCLLNSRVPLACTLALVLQRSENPPVVLSILRFVNIILILLYQSPDAGGSDKKHPVSVAGHNDKVLSSGCLMGEQKGEEAVCSTVKEQADDMAGDRHVSDAGKPQVHDEAGQDVDADTCHQLKKSEISYIEAQRTFVNQLFPVLVNLFNETACSTVKHQCILLATRLVTCLTPEGLEEISLTKFQSVMFAFPLTQMVYSVCVEEADEVVLHALKLSRCLLLKAPKIYTVVFRRLGLKPLFDQLADIWAHLCDAETSDCGFPALKITDFTGSQSNISSQHPKGEESVTVETLLAVGDTSGTTVIRVWHNWYLVRLEEQVCIFSQRAIILLQASSRGVATDDDDGSAGAGGSTGLCALALHTGSGKKAGGGPPACASLVLLPNRPLLHRPSLKANLLSMHRHFLGKITGSQSGIEISNLLSVPRSPAPSPEMPSHGGLRRHTGCGQNLASPLSSPLTRRSGSGGPGQGGSTSGFSHLLSKATLNRAGMHLGLRRTPRPAYSPSPDHCERSDLLQRQASSPARSCLPRTPRTVSPVLGGSELPAQVDTVSIGPFYFCLREAGAHGTCLCVQLRKYMNTRVTREALLFFEDDTLGFSRVRISPLQVTELVDRSRQPSQSEQEESANQEDSLFLPRRRRYSTSLINVLSELDKEFNSSLTPPPVVDSGEAVSSSLSTWHTGLIDTPGLFDLDILFGIKSPAAADDINRPTPSEDAGTSSRSRRHNSESSQIISELQRLSDLLFPSELVYETYTSGRLALPLQQPCASRTQSNSDADKTRQVCGHEKLFKTRRHAHKLTVRLSRFLSVPVEKWQCQPRPQGQQEGSTTGILPEPVASTSMLQLRQIIADIVSAFRANDICPPTSTLDDLSSAFRRLADLLTGDGEQAVTAYELTICGLVPALLLCLSAANAGRWECSSNVSGLDPVTDLLCYLHERRQLFLHSLSVSADHSSDATVSPLSNLVRRLVQAFELADHLPLCLHSLSPPSNPKPSRSTDFKWIMPKSQFLGAPGSRRCLADGPHQGGDLTAVERKTGPTAYRPLASLPVGVIKAATAAAAVDSRQESRQSDSGNCGHGQSRPHGQQVFADCLDSGEASALTRFLFHPSHLSRSTDCFSLGMNQVGGCFILTPECLPYPPGGERPESASLLIYTANKTSVQANPLVTVGQLRRLLDRMTMRQWYDQPRCQLPYWRQVELAADKGLHFPSPPLNGTTSCPVEHLGGVIDWVATNGGLLPLDSWCNPAVVGLVTVASSVARLLTGPSTAILGPRAGSLVGGYPVVCSGIGAVTRQTTGAARSARHDRSNAKGKSAGQTTIPAWFAIDLGLQLTPTAYSLAYLRRAEFESSLAPRKWRLDASNDAVHWTLLSSCQDESLQSISGSRATWHLEPQSPDGRVGDKVSAAGWRYFRIVSTGKNAGGGYDLALGGLEFYGTVHAVHPEVITPAQLAQRINSEFVKTVPSQTPPITRTKSTGHSNRCHSRTSLQRTDVQQSSGGDRHRRAWKEDAEGGILRCVKDGESLGQYLEICASDNDSMPPPLHSVVPSQLVTDDAATSDVGAGWESPQHTLETRPEDGAIDSDEAQCVAGVGRTSPARGEQPQDSPPAAPIDEENDTNPLGIECLVAQQPSSPDFFEDFGDAIEAIIHHNMSSTVSLIQSNAFTTDDLLTRCIGASDENANLAPTVTSDSEVTSLQFGMSGTTGARPSETVVSQQVGSGAAWEGQATTTSSAFSSCSDLPTAKPSRDAEPGPTPGGSKLSSCRVPVRRRARRPRPLGDPLTSASSTSSCCVLEPEQARRPVSSSASSNATTTLTTGTCGTTGSSTEHTARLHRQPLTWREFNQALGLPPGLIPVFNPHPGVTNAPATTPFTLLPAVAASCSTESNGDPQANLGRGRLTLFLIAKSGSRCVQQVPLLDDECTLFKYVQHLSDLLDPSETTVCDSDTEDTTRLSLSLGYREWHPDDEKMFTRLNHHLHSPHSKAGQKTFLSPTDLRLTPSLREPIRYLGARSPGTNARHMSVMAEDMASEDCDSGKDSLSSSDWEACHPEKILDLLGVLHQLSSASEPVRWHTAGIPPQISEPGSIHPLRSLMVTASLGDFLSPRLSKKLMLQLRDPLSVASGALPDWCLSLTRCLRPLFSFDVRLDLLRACAFGPARAVIWLQNLPAQPSFGSPSSPPVLSRQTSSSRNALLTATIAALPRSMRNLLTSSSLTSAYPMPVTTTSTSGTSGHVPAAGDSQRLGEDAEEAEDLEECNDQGALDDHQRVCDAPDLIFLLTTDSGSGAGQPDSPSTAMLVLRAVEGSVGQPAALDRDTGGADNPLFSSSSLEGESEGVEGQSLSPGHQDTSGAGGDDPGTESQSFPHREESAPSSQAPVEESTAEAVSGLASSRLWDFAARLMEQRADRKSELGVQLFDEDDDEFPLDILTSLLLATTGNQVLTNSTNTPRSNGSSRHWSNGRVGRLHKEFVRIPRLSREVLAGGGGSGGEGGRDRFWDWAARLMEQHACQKSELEIQFLGEDGTGLGPTLEFYSLLIAELRRKSSQMWVSADDTDDNNHNKELGEQRGSPAVVTADAPSPTGELESEQQREQELDQNRHEDEEQDVDVAGDDKCYVNSAHGLFPSPWPADRVPPHVLHRFYILGITIAKCLQDNRRIDLPLSMPFLKLLSVYGNIPYSRTYCHCRQPSPGDRENGSTDGTGYSGSLLPSFSEAAKVERVLTSIVHQNGGSSDASREDWPAEVTAFLLTPQYRRVHSTLVNGAVSELHWAQDILDLDDLCQVYPDRAYFFHQVMQFCQRKHAMDRPCEEQLEQLSRDIFGCSVGDLCLFMEFLPTFKSLAGYPLLDSYPWEKPTETPFTTNYHLPGSTSTTSASEDHQSAVSTNSKNEDVAEVEKLTVHNLDTYLTRMLAFCLDKGIRRQLEAFRAGFERVLPLSWLSLFNASELSQLVCGESLAQWTREDLLAYTVPSFGFTAQSPTYRMLINVLADFSVAERRAFLQFATGCSSLPYGGLKNLHPRLRIVRKEVAIGAAAGSSSSSAASAALPSVNTCVHYLKLPEYQSEAELRAALLRANREVGFYLN